MRSRRKQTPFEINIVPYVDVLLVLLLVFMVSASAWVQELNVVLPNVKGKDAKPDQTMWYIIIDDQGRTSMTTKLSVKSKHFLTEKDLKQQLKTLADENKSVYIQADKKVSYQTVAQVLSWIQSSGVTQVHLMTEQA